MRTEFLAHAIRRGVDQNIVVYDSENDRHRLTLRLIQLMIAVAKQNQIPINHLFVGKDVFDDDEEKIRVNHITIVPTRHLDKDSPVQKVYSDECKAGYAPNSYTTIVAVDINNLHDGGVLLGAI